jgi:hypothetical protein
LAGFAFIGHKHADTPFGSLIGRADFVDEKAACVRLSIGNRGLRFSILFPSIRWKHAAK